jgi:hypothetical protein
VITAKKRARNAVTYAMRTGRLVVQPCEQCGDPKSQAHHDDYAKPLDVRWLCRTHHNHAHGIGVDPGAVVSMHESGRKTLQEVGDAFGISHVRVHQILAARGITARRYGKRLRGEA